jgi:hypothetical protein
VKSPWIMNSSCWPEYLLQLTWSVTHLDNLKGCAKVSVVDVTHALKMEGANSKIYSNRWILRVWRGYFAFASCSTLRRQV